MSDGVPYKPICFLKTGMPMCWGPALPHSCPRILETHLDISYLPITAWSPKWDLFPKSHLEKLGRLFLGEILHITMGEHFISEKCFFPVWSAFKIPPTTHAESFLTILSSTRFPPAMHRETVLARTINHVCLWEHGRCREMRSPLHSEGSMAWECGLGSVCVCVRVSPRRTWGQGEDPEDAGQRLRGDATNHGATTMGKCPGPSALCNYPSL